MEELIKKMELDGYCVMPNVYDEIETEGALERVAAWEKRNDGFLTENIPFVNKNQPIVYNLQNKDAYFLKMLFAPEKLQKFLLHFLNDPWHKQISLDEPNYILRSFLARSSLKRLPMHIDSHIPYKGDHVYSMQCLIVLQDMNEENGCTIVVPGSHQSGEFATQEAFTDAVPITAKAGDVVLFDGRIWHGTTENISGKTRWSLIGSFIRWWIKQNYDMPRKLPQEIYQQLTDSQKAILGFCSIPFGDESEGIDMRQGYGALKANVNDYQSA